MRNEIKHPIITEKATLLSQKGQYVFLVDKNAVKPEIKKEIKKRYNVDAVKIRIINIKSKQRRLGYSRGSKPGYKKAIVTLQKGQQLDILPH